MLPLSLPLKEPLMIVLLKKIVEECEKASSLGLNVVARLCKDGVVVQASGGPNPVVAEYTIAWGSMDSYKEDHVVGLLQILLRQVGKLSRLPE